MEHFLRDSAGRPAEVQIESRTPCAPQPLPPSPWGFPDPRLADAGGLVGVGADFQPSTVLAAYTNGIFPWPHPESEYLWFSPHPRAILPPGGLHVSRRLGRVIRSGRFRATIDAAFWDVMRACTENRPEGTWITGALRSGYSELHSLGWAHSVEVWEHNWLVGGLYGVGLGAMFGAESMFHRTTDASKVAMVALAQHARTIGIELIDIQVLTDHTERMGGVEIARDEYLARLADALAREVRWR